MCKCWVGMNGEKLCKCDDTGLIDPRSERYKNLNQSPQTAPEAGSECMNLLNAIPCLKQRHDSTRSQLQDLYRVANKLGLCDAADALKANFGI